MKIIGIGLPKTGTSSLHDALKILGYKSVHFPHDPRTVAQIRGGDYALDVLKTADAVSDVPIPAIFPRLDTAFPGSKFIQTDRDVDAWIESERKAPFNNDRPTPGSPRDFYRAVLYGVTDFNEEQFRFVHARHLMVVESYFAGERAKDLLRMDITRGDGWDKLCAFLGKPVPDLPFPRSNTAEMSAATYRTDQRQGLRRVVDRLRRRG
ncbi:sulfotransferase family protein [Tabrizicola sp.]|uniref:sulfotransferase family protein n=1 Tax=Tabrizicola sp. TaxID=2005166 RepID=UPI003F335CFD